MAAAGAQGQSIESDLYSYTLTIRTDPANVRVHRGQLQIERVHSVYRIGALGHDVADSGVVLTRTDAGQAPMSGSEPAGPFVPAESHRRRLGAVSFTPLPLISGSGTTNAITKWLDGPSGVVGDANVAEANGSVVVGNGSFYGNLHIFGAAGADVFAGMGPNLVTGPAFNYGYAGGSFGRSAGFFNVRPDALAVAPNPSLRFMTANFERMIITRTGSVGIGTSTPVAKLEVVGDQLSTAYGLIGPNFLGRRAQGTFGSPSSVLSQDMLVRIAASGYTPTTGFSPIKAGIDVLASEDWTDSANGTYIRLFTTLNGSINPLVRLRINDDGTIGIGTQAALSEKLHVFGDVRVGTAGTNGCVQRFDGASIAGTCVSDLRLKRDITSFPQLLDDVVKLRPVHYYWRSDEFPQRQFGTRQAYGLIAQEVEQVFPELVTSNDHGYKQVDYSKLPLLTLQAIKELKAENDALKQRLAALEARLTGMKKR